MGYSTQDIVNQISNEINNNYKDLKEYEGDFEKWKSSYQKIENKIQFIFPEEVLKNFPLNDNVLKLIIKKLYNVMPFNKEYILKNYEHNEYNHDYLLFPSKNPKKMIILFSGLSGHKTYNRYSWYWDENEKWEQDTVYLFLNDLKEEWYVGNENEPRKEKYIKIIQKTLKDFNIERKNTITVGGSMGGYASILFAFDMGLRGDISIHPQINQQSLIEKKTGIKHNINKLIKKIKKENMEVKYRNDWGIKISKCGKEFQNLDEFIFKRNTIPYIYLEYGDFNIDREGAEELIRQFQKRQIFLIIRKTINPEHVTLNPSKETIKNIEYLFYNNGFEDEYTH